jgi:hypothetical protein
MARQKGKKAKQPAKDRARHTAKLRESYAAAARQSREISKQWDPLSDEVWARLPTELPDRG